MCNARATIQRLVVNTYIISYIIYLYVCKESVRNGGGGGGGGGVAT